MKNNFSLMLEEQGRRFDFLIKKEIGNFCDSRQIKKLTQLPCAPGALASIKKSLYLPLSDFMDRKSKKLRPIFGFLLLEALNGDTRKYERFFILPELLHSASLIIDDIEDNATKRRNKPALHCTWGLDTAVNAGNALYFLPFHVIQESNLAQGKKESACEILIEAMNRIHIGQGLDILWHKNPKLVITSEQYLQMVRLKTSSFFRAEARLALLLASQGRSLEKKWNSITENLGAAFQIMDDLLDLTLTIKESARFGKNFSQDIAEGKKTLVLIYAFQKATNRDKKRLIDILSAHSYQQNFRNDVLDILKKYNSIEQTRHFVQRLAQQVKHDISISLKDSTAKTYLKHYCDFMTERKY